MGYAILRTQKLKAGQAILRSLKHAFREQDTPNADPARTPNNTHIGADCARQALELINARLPGKVRSNAVLAVEYLIAASPENMQAKSREEQDGYFRDALAWLENKHGKDNLIYAGIHRDETSPHMYAYVVPIDGRGKLNCRAFLGGPKALNEMQTDFAQQVGLHHGLQRGIEGSRAKHTTIQEYYARINAGFQPLPVVKTTVTPVRKEPEKPGLLAPKEAKEAWQAEHKSWLQEQTDAVQSAQKRAEEEGALRQAAVDLASRYEAQAREAEALKSKLSEIKKSNGVYAKKIARLESELRDREEIIQFLTADEIASARQRKKQQAAAALEKALCAEIEKEVVLRIAGIEMLLQQAGAVHVFAENAIAAIQAAGTDGVSQVDWEAVEAATIRDSIAEHGQTAESVIEAITRYSPGCADSGRHEEVRRAIQLVAPQLETL